MKIITLILLLLPLNGYACSCWHMREIDRSKSFIVTPLAGEAIYPVSVEERKRLMEAGEVTTVLEVIAPQKSGMNKGREITYKQRYGLCTAFFLPNGKYRIDIPPEDGVIEGSRCSIHLVDTGQVPEGLDQETVDLMKQVNEFDQMRPYAR